MHDVAVLASQESREKISSVDVLQEVPNITMQSTAEDTQALGVGVDRVVATTVNAADAPPLCHSWVGLSCTRGPLECQGRHYYISVAERDKWVKKREKREQALDMEALHSVLSREMLLEKLRAAAGQTKKIYLEDPGNSASVQNFTLDEAQQFNHTRRIVFAKAYSVVEPVLTILDQLRVSGVECVETLTAWREYYARQRRIVARAGRKSITKGRIWIATIESEGRQLWGPIPAVYSHFKKYQRGVLPAKRAQITKFLAVYGSREAAIQAHDAAKPRVAMERRALVSELPPRAERETYGGISIIETRGSKSLPQLEHAVRSRVQADDPPPPAYFYDGENYLVKMTKDLNWLDSLAPLRICLGPDFPLTNNPFMLTNELRETIQQNPLLEIPALVPRLTAQNQSPRPRVTKSKAVKGCELASVSVEPLLDACNSRNKVPGRRSKENFNVATPFGTPTDVVKRHVQGALISWEGEMRLGSNFDVQDPCAYYKKIQYQTLHAQAGDANRNVTVLDTIRVSRAVARIEEETRTFVWPSESASGDEDGSDHDSDDVGDSLDDQSDAQESTSQREREVWAQYEKLQATLVVQQSRASLKGIIDGVFCRAERGKWKGVGIPGPATRTYWFKRRLQEDGERRKARRDLIAARLRRETARGLIRMRPIKMASLLELASELRGAGRIAVDAHRAKLLLERRYSAEICAAILERYIRGIHGRRSARKHKRMLGLSFEMRRSRRDMCLNVAKAVVNFALNAASSQIAHKLTAPAHITTGYLDGDRCFFLVYSLDHRMRVTSSSRQYLSERPNFDSYESASLTTSKVVRPILSRDPATGSLRHDRAPCIDGANQHSEQSAEHVLWIRPPETLLVTCYNPVTQQTCAVEVKEPEFRDRLVEAEMATVGGAVTLYPDPIDRDEIGRLARLRPVSQADSILGDTHQKRDRWEPIFEEKAFKEKLHTAGRRQKACFSLWSKAVAVVAASADQCELSQSRFELMSMSFEEALMRRHPSHISSPEAIPRLNSLVKKHVTLNTHLFRVVVT